MLATEKRQETYEEFQRRHGGMALPLLLGGSGRLRIYPDGAREENDGYGTSFREPARHPVAVALIKRRFHSNRMILASDAVAALSDVMHPVYGRAASEFRWPDWAGAAPVDSAGRLDPHGAMAQLRRWLAESDAALKQINDELATVSPHTRREIAIELGIAQDEPLQQF